VTSLLDSLGYLEFVLCVVALCFLLIRRQWRDYWALGLFLAVRVASNICLKLILYEASRGVARHTAYRIYFYVYWCAFAIESILAIVIIFSILRLTMAPLRGLQILGTLMFCSAAVTSVAVALRSAFLPNMTGTKYLVAAISQLQRTESLITLCLLLFVCIAIRPMGLSYHSRVFGVSLGLGLLAINDLVESAWLVHHPQMHTFYNLVNAFVFCAALAIWAAYFALREPRRREIAISPTSTLYRWNQRSLAWFG
jgi:hypothetical protein